MKKFFLFIVLGSFALHSNLTAANPAPPSGLIPMIIKMYSSQETRDTIVNGIIITALSAAGFFTIKGTATYITARNTCKNTQLSLEDLETKFPSFAIWLSKRQDKKYISSLIKDAHPCTLVRDYKIIQNKYNELSTYYKYLLEETPSMLLAKTKLGDDYQKLKDAVLFTNTFLEKGRFKYVEQMVKLVSEDAYFSDSLKNAPIQAKATTMFPGDFNIHATTSNTRMPKDVLQLKTHIIKLASSLNVHRNSLLSLKDNLKRKELFVTIEILAKQILDDLRTIEKEFKTVAVPTTLRDPLATSKESVNHPGTNTATINQPLTSTSPTTPSKTITTTPSEVNPKEEITKKEQLKKVLKGIGIGLAVTIPSYVLLFGSIEPGLSPTIYHSPPGCFIRKLFGIRTY